MKTIFVSSTFKDMHKERDALQKITLPILYEEAKKWGENVEICDLRWGVNTEDMDNDASSTKVLNVCLDEIDRCQPPMVVILGYRYGWIPDEKIIDSVAKRYHIALDDLEKSVTTLEIEYGALSEKRKKDRTLFYFREIEGDVPSAYGQEDDYHFQKLTQLKKRIMKISGGSVKTYKVKWENGELTQIDSFAKMVAEDVLSILRSDWETVAKLTPLEKELRTHRLYAEDKLSHFYAKRKKADKLLSDICKNDNGALILGESGSGKSTLMSYFAKALEDKGFDTIPLFSSLTTHTSSANGILELLVEALEARLDLEGSREVLTLSQLKNRLYLLVNECERRKKNIAILVDSLDQLLPDENRDQLIFVPTKLSKRVKFIASALPQLEINSTLTKYEWEAATQEEVNDIITGIEKARHRELSKEVRFALLEKEGAQNPLYLDLLVQRLIMMNESDFVRIRDMGDGMDAITNHQLSLIKQIPESLKEMSVSLFLDSSERINPRLIEKCARYLAFSRYGLRQSDLKELLKDQWNGLDFSSFIHYLRDSLFIRADGRVDFVHRSFKLGLRDYFIEKENITQNELLNYLFTLPKDDPIRAQELAYHAICADNKEAYISHILATDDENQRNNAITTAQKCIEDEGAWFSRLCEYVKENAEDNLDKIGEFLINILPDYFGQGNSQLKAKARALNAALELIKAFAQDKKCLELLIDGYILLGETSNEINEGYAPEDMCICYESAVLYAQRLNDDYRLARAYTSLAKGYGILNGTEYSLCATEYYKKAIELLDKNPGNTKTLLDAYIGLGEQNAGEAAKLYFLKATVVLEALKGEFGKESYLIKKADIYRRLAIAERAILVNKSEYGDALKIDFSSQIIKEIKDYLGSTSVVSYEVLEALASLYSDIVNSEVARQTISGIDENNRQKSIFSSVIKVLGGTIKSKEVRSAYKNAKALYQKIYAETKTTSSSTALAGIKTIGLMYMGDLSGALNKDQALANVFSQFATDDAVNADWSVFGIDKERDFEKDYRKNDNEGCTFGNLSFLLVTECNEGREMLERAYEKRRALLESQSGKEARFAEYCLLARYTETCLYTDTMRGYLRAQRIGKEAKKVIEELVKDYDCAIYKKAQYTTYYRLASAYYASKDYQLSYDYLIRTKEIMKELKTEEELDIALINYKLAKIIRLDKIKDKYEEGYELIKEAVSIIHEKEGSNQLGDSLLAMLGDKSILSSEAKSEFYRELIATSANVGRYDEAENAFDMAENLVFMDENEKIYHTLPARIEIAFAYASSEDKRQANSGIELLEELLDLLGELYDFDPREEYPYENLKIYDIFLAIAKGHKNAGNEIKAKEYYGKAYNYGVQVVKKITGNKKRDFYPNANEHMEHLLLQIEDGAPYLDNVQLREKCIQLAGLFDDLKNAYIGRKYFYDKQRARACIMNKTSVLELLISKDLNQENLTLLFKAYSDGLENALENSIFSLIESYAIRIVNTAEENEKNLDDYMNSQRHHALTVLTILYTKEQSPEMLERAKICGDVLISTYGIKSVTDPEFFKSYKLSLEHAMKNASDKEKELITQIIQIIDGLPE